MGHSKVVQELFAETFGDSSTPVIDEIFDNAVSALEKQGDAENLSISLCTVCGFLSFQKIVEKCPHCGAGPLQEL
jgi:rubrerythrin